MDPTFAQNPQMSKKLPSPERSEQMRQDELPVISRGSLGVVASGLTPRATPQCGLRPGHAGHSSKMARRQTPVTPRISQALQAVGGLRNLTSVAQLLQDVINSTVDTSDFAQTVASRASDGEWLSALGIAVRELGLLVSESIEKQPPGAVGLAHQRLGELEELRIQKAALQAALAARERELKQLRADMEFHSLFSEPQTPRVEPIPAAAPSPDERKRQPFEPDPAATMQSAVRSLIERSGLGRTSVLPSEARLGARTERLAVREEFRRKWEAQTKAKLERQEKLHAEQISELQVRGGGREGEGPGGARRGQEGPGGRGAAKGKEGEC